MRRPQQGRYGIIVLVKGFDSQLSRFDKGTFLETNETYVAYTSLPTRKSDKNSKGA